MNPIELDAQVRAIVQDVIAHPEHSISGIRRMVDLGFPAGVSAHLLMVACIDASNKETTDARASHVGASRVADDGISKG